MLRRPQLKTWLCLFWHPWRYKTRGIQAQGSVYAKKVRICKRCGISETEIFDPKTKVVTWVESQGSQSPT